MSDIRKQLKAEKSVVDRQLLKVLNSQKGIPARLKAAMKHSLASGGKRLRPILMLWTYDTFSNSETKTSRDSVMLAACALEMIHTYSLIHDDLPAMDDDVLRRGKPTCHVAFDEPTAILAGDGLQALAFGLLAQAGGDLAGPLVQMVAQAVGPAGMVGGQQDDLDAEGKVVSAALVKRIHLGKTARLLAVSLTSGALLAGAGEDIMQGIETGALDLGLAFQGADDVLDIVATVEQLGKSPGKDAAAGKATLVAVNGLEKAQKRTNALGFSGIKTLTTMLPTGDNTDRLIDLGKLMWQRDR